ncbi:MAG: PIN domain-containing protein [Candidatus Shapirobacteria bacterium]
MRWIDSNIFLRYWNGQDDAVRFLDKLKIGKTKYIVSAYVLSELEWVMRSFYKENKTDIVEFIESILGIDNIIIENKVNIEKSMRIFEQYNIKLIDSIIAESMNTDDEIVSYDHDFDKLPNIKRIEPKDLVG